MCVRSRRSAEPRRFRVKAGRVALAGVILSLGKPTLVAVAGNATEVVLDAGCGKAATLDEARSKRFVEVFERAIARRAVTQ